MLQIRWGVRALLQAYPSNDAYVKAGFPSPPSPNTPLYNGFDIL